jgi:hypothetical protein
MKIKITPIEITIISWKSKKDLLKRIIPSNTNHIIVEKIKFHFLGIK